MCLGFCFKCFVLFELFWFLFLLFLGCFYIFLAGFFVVSMFLFDIPFFKGISLGFSSPVLPAMPNNYNRLIYHI